MTEATESRETGVDQTRDRILNAALETLVIFGSRRFSMSAVSDLAGVSRGTLYRYFPTKGDLLDAITAHLGREFRRFLQSRESGETDIARRISTVVTAMNDYVDRTPILTQLLDAEPRFVRSFYTEQFHGLLRLVSTAIAPRLDSASQAERIRIMAMAEILARLAMSYRIVDKDSGALDFNDFTTQLVATLESAAPATGAARRAGRSRHP